MKQIRKALRVLSFIVYILVPAICLAAPSTGKPEVVVQSMLTELKSEADPAVLLDYVHWPTAWKSFPQTQRDKIGIRSPEELKEYFENFFKDPDQFIEKYIMSRYEGSQALPEQSITKMAETMKRKKAQMREKMKNTSYEIGKSTIQGNAASVEIVSTLNGKSKSQTLPLQNIDGKWYLPTMKLLDDSQGVPR